MKLNPAITHYQNECDFYNTNEIDVLPERIPTYIATGPNGDYARPAKTIGELPGKHLRKLALKLAAEKLAVDQIHFGLEIYKTLGMTKNEALKDGRSWLLQNGDNLKVDLFWHEVPQAYPLDLIARTYPTPVGDMPIREHVRVAMSYMTDRELVNAIVSRDFINPEFMGEALHRNLIWRGATTEEIYQAVEKRELLAKQNKVIK
ncbi:hypothetical protein HPY09_20415 (plasmid) [Vibrio cholerae]|uniref:hypothetical protein n=1 Tax=Vibrio cholerae TaxID=666 RepID=UPI0011832C35|nr:hypothetical protein [Vibrio cholerae]EJL6462230.1 hypothetical protein [Vibrio cholerae]MBJ6953119.1 hypothetical protein [Vibrio cholerae]MVC22384.1 hypothetical protein [Vibrio cholerae]QKU73304.1 hypothetical protein HPY09_20415 [Vibrio cholerae]QKU77294.1 hypothetical protein HPY05_20610 [Vibrio cholerae]